jgi:hypothetical protein
LNAIEGAAALILRWSEEVDETHAQPGTVAEMRRVANDARTEHAKLERAAAALDATIKLWATRELERLPRGPWGDWLRTGVMPRALQVALTGLPEPVAALVGAHVADEISECEICRRRAPCRMMSDRSESGESDWRCAWGCPANDDPIVQWARSVGL